MLCQLLSLYNVCYLILYYHMSYILLGMESFSLIMYPKLQKVIFHLLFCRIKCLMPLLPH